MAQKKAVALHHQISHLLYQQDVLLHEIANLHGSMEIGSTVTVVGNREFFLKADTDGKFSLEDKPYGHTCDHCGRKY